MPDIVIPEFMDEAAVREGLQGFDVLYAPDLVDRPDDLAAALREARGLIVRNRTQVRGPLLDAAQSLKAVGRLGVGLDNIDMAACEARGIAVFPARGANDISVAEYVIAAAMLLLRGAYTATSDVIAGSWPRNRLMGREISGKRLGLVGYRLHRSRDRQARGGLGHGGDAPSIRSSKPSTRPGTSRSDAWCGLASTSCIATSDVVSLHVPLTPDTRGLLGREAIGRMKPGAVVVNARARRRHRRASPRRQRCGRAASAAPPSTCSRRSRCPRRARRSSPAAPTLSSRRISPA